jgi:3-deoxy-D-manno-octulosonic-acid transferase
MPTLFDAFYAAAVPVLLPPLVYRRMVLKKYRESLPGMLGRNLKVNGPDAPSGTAGTGIPPTAWLHAVSVGEVVAAGAVLEHLAREKPGWRYLASTVTETGQKKARQALKSAAEIFFYPLDFSWIVRRFFDHYRPNLIIIHETELWPNFLLEARSRGIPVFLANGKLSPRSARRYKQGRFLFARPLSAFSAFCMQTEADAERLRSLGVPEKKIHVTGNCKFDNPGEPLTPEQRREGLARWGWGEDTPVIVAGSTHSGEEEVVLAAFRTVRQAYPRARLLLAPRHPERFDAVAELVEREQWRVWRVSRVDNAGSGSCSGFEAGGPDVVLLDTIGQLARAYGLGQIALCAGSWVPIGGHNLLEAAVHAVPVLRGPYMQNQPDIVRILGPEHGGLEVTAEGLGGLLCDLLGDAGRRNELGQRAARAVAGNRGAAARTVETLLRHISFP